MCLISIITYTEENEQENWKIWKKIAKKLKNERCHVVDHFADVLKKREQELELLSVHFIQL